MKKYLILVLVPVLYFVMLTCAHAGVYAGSGSITPFVGGYTFIGGEHLETAPVYGLRLGYNFTRHFGAELVGEYLWTETTYIGQPERDVEVAKYGLDFLYHFMPDGPFVPFFAAGVGGITRQYPGEGNDRTKLAYNYGVGFKYFFTDSIAFRGDFRHVMMHDDGPLPGRVPPTVGGNGTYHNLEYTAGIDFQFGGRKPAAVPAAAPVTAPPSEEAQPPAPAPEAQPEAPLAPVPAAEPAPGRSKYCVTLHIEFDVDQALIRPEYYDEVGKVGNFMKKYPTTTAVIEGHTDNVGDPNYNMQLSQRRAESVVNYLVEKFGIDRSRLTARGYGMTKPVADNGTDEGKQKNRRIEAIIDCAFDVRQIPPPEKLCMGLQIEFDTGKADIKPQYHDEIAKVGDFMKANPTTTAVIEGHTDNIGSSDTNMKLSQQRAENVMNYLVENFGIDRSRLSAKGYGSTRRIAYNNTPEGRQKNRRISAVIDCVIKR